MVVDGGVDIPVSDMTFPVSGLFSFIAVSSCPPAAPRRDRRQFLDVDMDQITRVVPLIPGYRSGVGGPVTRSRRPTPAWFRILWTVEAANPTSKPIRSAPQRRLQRSLMTRRRS